MFTAEACARGLSIPHQITRPSSWRRPSKFGHRRRMAFSCAWVDREPSATRGISLRRQADGVETMLWNGLRFGFRYRDRGCVDRPGIRLDEQIAPAGVPPIVAIPEIDRKSTRLNSS